MANSGHDAPWRMLVFGASGAIGRAICEKAKARGFHVVGASRQAGGAAHEDWIVWDPAEELAAPAEITRAKFDGVCWAQGANVSDALHDFDPSLHLDVYKANCLFVLNSLSALLGAGALRSDGARLCVISSIWEQRARQRKLSYTMTKAAVGGLVRSASVDLASGGHLINGVLPGVLDTPMTLENLTPEQLEAVKSATPFGRLPDLATVAELACFLCSPENRSISGQSIAVDLGFSNGRSL